MNGSRHDRHGKEQRIRSRNLDLSSSVIELKSLRLDDRLNILRRIAVDADWLCNQWGAVETTVHQVAMQSKGSGEQVVPDPHHTGEALSHVGLGNQLHGLALP